MNETKREIEAHAAIDAGYEVMTYDTPLTEFPMADNDINGINQIILLVGKRRTGKTYWVRDFMETYKHQLPYVFVFSKTKYNGYWQQYLPEYCIFSEFDEAVVKKILDAQISRIKETGINSAICLLFDGILLFLLFLLTFKQILHPTLAFVTLNYSMIYVIMVIVFMWD